MSINPRYEQQEIDKAAMEAAQVGGRAKDDELLDPAGYPVREAGGGVAEGFEEAENVLIEHASHGDQQSAHAVLHDQGKLEEENDRRADAEANHERSSEAQTD